MEMDREKLVMACMEMIGEAGEGRGFVHEALALALEEKYLSARVKLDAAEPHLAEAHRIQFEELMGPQKKGTEIPFDLLLLHAMDLLMVATSERDMLEKLVAAGLARAAAENESR